MLGKVDLRSMTDKEILDKYIDLEKSCVTEEEKKEVMEMHCKCKDAFSLRDEIGTFPDIEVLHKSPFFIRPYHVKEEYKALIDTEMKRFVLFRYIERKYFNIFQSSDVDQ